MKTVFILGLLVCSLFAFSQSTVTINTTGNRNKQILVDGKSYSINNTAASDSILISDLAAGQHTLELVRTNQYDRNASTKTSFTLRDGYDLTLTISANGSISTTENRIARSGDAGRGQLTTAAFNKLYAQAKAKTSSTSRSAFLEAELKASNKHLTSQQASQLIQLVSTESLRLKLAKQSYAKISDPQNFSLVSNLLSSTTNRSDLNNYIASLSTTTPGNTGDVNNAIPLSDAAFQSIHDEVVAEPTSADRVYYLNNFFNRDFNYYTTAQARQLIELVSTEQDRLAVAKSAYRGVTDKENYNTVYTALNSSANRSDLAAYIRNYDVTNPRSSMATADFDKLYQSVYNLYSSSARYTAINKAFTTAGNYFTTAQAKKLIPLVSDEASRLQLAKTSYKVLVDRTSYQQFNDFLSSTTSRNELNTYVNNYEGTGIAVKTAMETTEFNSLYRKVQLTFGIGAKYSALTDIFNTETYYFTVAQAKQLIQLVSSENNRLELAKSSYNNITDPANISQLYTVFSSQTSKNALMNYIASNAYNN